MAGTSAGSMKRLAALVGITLHELSARIEAGEKYCWRCRALHPRSAFNVDESRADGLYPACRDSLTANNRAQYRPRPRTSKLGTFFAPNRDGDKKQARSRVNHHVDVGLLPDPNDVPCFDCGHIYATGERRHEYDHHLGYAEEHQLSVQAVCTTCHRARDQRQTHCDRGHEFTPDNTHVGKGGQRTCRACRRMREKQTRTAEWWRARRERMRDKNNALTNHAEYSSGQ